MHPKELSKKLLLLILGHNFLNDIFNLGNFHCQSQKQKGTVFLTQDEMDLSDETLLADSLQKGSNTDLLARAADKAVISLDKGLILQFFSGKLTVPDQAITDQVQEFQD